MITYLKYYNNSFYQSTNCLIVISLHKTILQKNHHYTCNITTCISIYDGRHQKMKCNVNQTTNRNYLTMIPKKKQKGCFVKTHFTKKTSKKKENTKCSK